MTPWPRLSLTNLPRFLRIRQADGQRPPPGFIRPAGWLLLVVTSVADASLEGARRSLSLLESFSTPSSRGAPARRHRWCRAERPSRSPLRGASRRPPLRARADRRRGPRRLREATSPTSRRVGRPRRHTPHLRE